MTKVLVDANVLYSRTLRDWLFLLKFRSGGGMFSIHASEDIIAETLYCLRRKNPAVDGRVITGIHDRIVECLDSRVDDFKIDGSFTGRDENDAHVHASVMACDAEILLSADEGFREAGQDSADALPYEVYTPDEFFVLLDDSASSIVRDVVDEQLTYWYRKRGEVDLPAQLRRAGCPVFADRVREHLQTLPWDPPTA